MCNEANGGGVDGGEVEGGVDVVACSALVAAWAPSASKTSGVFCCCVWTRAARCRNGRRNA